MVHMLITGDQVQLTVCTYVPLGRPSCCSSFARDASSTSYLAALPNMKDSTATDAFTSDSSEHPHKQFQAYIHMNGKNMMILAAVTQ